jgi:hypothetical protein
VDDERHRSGATNQPFFLDATYLEIAVRLGLPLATTDRVLRLAATNLDVPAFLPRRSG